MLFFGIVLMLTGCGSGGGGNGGGTTPVPVPVPASMYNYTIGGTVSGLSGTLALQNNGGDVLTITAYGAFTFNTALADGSAYSVTILTSPVLQNCTITNGNGNISGADITDISINCADKTLTRYTDVTIIHSFENNTDWTDVSDTEHGEAYKRCDNVNKDNGTVETSPGNYVEGSGALEFEQAGRWGDCWLKYNPSGTADLSGKYFRLWIRLDTDTQNGTNNSSITDIIYNGNATLEMCFYTDSTNYACGESIGKYPIPDGETSVDDNGRWTAIYFYPAQVELQGEVGNINWVSIDYYKFHFQADGGVGYAVDMWIDGFVALEMPKVAAVGLKFDDGYDDAWNEAKAYMDTKGLRGIENIITSRINTTNYLTMDNLKQMDAQGWTIANHTHNHYNLGTASISDLKIMEEVTMPQRILQKNGIDNRFIVYPNGGPSKVTYTAMDYIQRLYVAGFGSGNEFNTVWNDENPAWQRGLCQWNVNLYADEAATVQALKDCVTQTEANYGVTWWNFHQIISGASSGLSINITTFQNLIDWLALEIAAGRIINVTYSDWYDFIKPRPTGYQSENDIPAVEQITCASNTCNARWALYSDITYFTTENNTVTDVYTLPDGDTPGFRKTVYLITDGGGDLQISYNGGATLTFDTVEENATFLWDGNNWKLEINNGGV